MLNKSICQWDNAPMLFSGGSLQGACKNHPSAVLSVIVHLNLSRSKLSQWVAQPHLFCPFVCHVFPFAPLEKVGFSTWPREVEIFQMWRWNEGIRDEQWWVGGEIDRSIRSEDGEVWGGVRWCEWGGLRGASFILNMERSRAHQIFQSINENWRSCFHL